MASCQTSRSVNCCLFTDALADAPEIQYAKIRKRHDPRFTEFDGVYFNHRPGHSPAARLRKRIAADHNESLPIGARVSQDYGRARLLPLRSMLVQVACKSVLKEAAACAGNRTTRLPRGYRNDVVKVGTRVEAVAPQRSRKTDTAIETQGEGLSINIP